MTNNKQPRLQSWDPWRSLVEMKSRQNAKSLFWHKDKQRCHQSDKLLKMMSSRESGYWSTAFAYRQITSKKFTIPAQVVSDQWRRAFNLETASGPLPCTMAKCPPHWAMVPRDELFSWTFHHQQTSDAKLCIMINLISILSKIHIHHCRSHNETIKYTDCIVIAVVFSVNEFWPFTFCELIQDISLPKCFLHYLFFSKENL